jgi:hypothetical protein
VMASDTETDDIGGSPARLSSVPVFKSEKLKFHDWARRFAALYTQKHCAEALEMDLMTRLPVNPTIEAQEEEDRKRHSLGIKQRNKSQGIVQHGPGGRRNGYFL